MLKMKITKNGRTIPVDRLADEMMKDVRAAAEKQIGEDVRRRLSGVRCAEHAMAIRGVRVSVGDNDQATVTVDPCCEQAKPAIDAIMGGSAT